MTLVAVSCRSCMGQSRKDRSALVPAGTTILSCITEFKLISQYDSGFLFSICRLNPSSFRRSTVQRSEQNRKINSMLFISNLEAWNIQGTKLTQKTQKQWFQTLKQIYRLIFSLHGVPLLNTSTLKFKESPGTFATDFATQLDRVRLKSPCLLAGWVSVGATLIEVLSPSA